MKKYLIILCVSCLGFSFTQAQTRSFKRGVGFNNLLTGDVQALSPGVSWGYNWGQSGSNNDAAFSKYNFEYVPMCWNGVNTAQLRTLLLAHPEIKYILGFNEPNFKAQANLIGNCVNFPITSAIIFFVLLSYLYLILSQSTG